MIPGFLSGWRLWAALGALLVLAVFIWQVVSWYQKARELDAVREEALKIEERRNEDEERMLRNLEAERARTREFADLAQSLGAQLAIARSVRAETRREVAALPADQLERRIQADLGLRRPDDPTIGFHPEELRGIAHAVSEYPLVLDELKKMDERLAALEEKSASQQRQIEILEAGYTTLKGHYVQLYNVAGAKKRRKWPPKCWFVKCETKLPVPSPDELKLETVR